MLNVSGFSFQPLAVTIPLSVLLKTKFCSYVEVFSRLQSPYLLFAKIKLVP